MRLSPDEINYISRKIVKVLTADRRIEVDDEGQVIDGIARVIVEELQIEDRLNEEVREVLIQHSAADGPLGHRLLGDVQEGEAGAGQAEGDHPVKLSRERVLNLSHLILRYMDSEDALEYFDEPQEIRQTIVQIITGEMRADEMIDALVPDARSRARSGPIPEGVQPSGTSSTGSTSRKRSPGTAR